MLNKLCYSFVLLLASLFISSNVMAQDEADCFGPGIYNIVPETGISGSGTSADPYVICGNSDGIDISSSGVAEGTGGFEAPALVFALYTEQPVSTNPSGTGATGVVLSNEDGVVFDDGIAYFSNTSIGYGTYVIVPIIVPDSTAMALIPDANCSGISLSENYTVITILNPGDNAELCCVGTAPENNTCSTATPLNIGENGTFNNACASADGEACDGWFGFGNEPIVNNSLWFSIVGNGNDITITSTACTDFGINDTQFALYEESCDGENIACAEDIGVGNLYSTITFASQFGVTYYLLVDGWGGAVGDYCLEVISDEPDCTNSDLAVTASIECVLDTDGTNTGFATLNVEPSGGVGEYNISIQPEIIDLYDGDIYGFNILVTDEMGCSAAFNMEGIVNCPVCDENPPIIAADYIVCEGETITISPPDGLNGETAEVGPGSYTFEYFDDNGCVALILDAGVGEAIAVLQQINQICEVDANGNNTGFGTIEVVVVSNIEGELNNITGLPTEPIAHGESYSFTIEATDGFDCVFSFLIEEVMDCPPFVDPCENSDLTLVASVECEVDANGNNIGTAILVTETTGGFGTVSVEPDIDIFQNGDSYAFMVTAIDELGCTASVFLEGVVDCPPFVDPCENSDLTLTASIECEVDANGNNIGTAILVTETTGGVGIVNVEPDIDVFQHGDSYAFMVTAFDELGCTASVFLEGVVDCPPFVDPCENSDLAVFAQVICDVDEAGNNTGFAFVDVQPTGGEGEYTTSIEPQVIDLITGDPYNFTITVVDELGCIATVNIEGIVNCPIEQCDFTTNVVTTPACNVNGVYTGSATINVEPAGEYSYNWSPNVSSNNFADELEPGTYEVTVSTSEGLTVDTLFFEDFENFEANWVFTETGVNEDGGNIWEISDAENGEEVGNCGSGFGGDNSLYITCTSGAFCGSGALYNAAVTSNVQATSPQFTAMGYNNVTMSFSYIGYGEPGDDYITLLYSNDGGETWLEAEGANPPEPTVCCSIIGGEIVPCNDIFAGQGVWTASENYNLPANVTNIALNWTNSNNNSGFDPSFAIDDIVITGETFAEGCSETVYVIIEEGEVAEFDELNIGSLCADNSVINLNDYTPEILNGVTGVGGWYNGADNSGEVVDGEVNVSNGSQFYYEFISDFGGCVSGVVSNEIIINELPEITVDFDCMIDDNTGANSGEALLLLDVAFESGDGEIESPYETGAIFNHGDIVQFEIIATDNNGCSSSYFVDEVINCPIAECEIELGEIEYQEHILCSDEEVSGTISFANLTEGAIGYYAIVTISVEGEFLDIHATNDTGIFSFEDLSDGNYYQMYYLSYVAETAECGMIYSVGPSVIWTAPIEAIVNQDCDESTNFYTFDMIFNFTGGLPQLEPSMYSYNVAGTLNGEYSFGETYIINVADLEPYAVIVEDDLGCSTEASGVFDPCSKTAIELISFTGRAEGDKNIIQWSTASEYLNDSFVLEKSYNGVEFEFLAQVKGAGVSSSVNDYVFVDENITEKIYYRLNSVDENGFSVKHDIILIERSNSLFTINMYQQAESLLLDIESVNNGELLVNLFNVNGQLVAAKSTSINEGRNTEALNLSKLPQGVYFVNCQLNGKIVNKSFIRH